MRLVSTRHPSEKATFAQAIQRGLAPGGGLYHPEPIPCFRDVEGLLEMDFLERSTEILWRMLGDEFSRGELEAAARAAFDFPVPVARVASRTFALELFHGPTLAFKDFGARFLAQAFSLVADREGGERTILTATSGDTGAAVAHAFHGRPGFKVVVLYPEGRVSPLQERQFCTLGGNVRTFRVRGAFDDCQAMVKGAFEDPALTADLGLTSANSINIARILAQTLYYFEALARLREAGHRDAPVVSVPSGNFGDLLAGMLARRMGLPVKAFVAACNANSTVPDYLDSGEYRPRPSVATLSSAMDVGAPSNWERIKALHPDLEELRGLLRWGSFTDAQTRRAMWELNALGWLPEPHAAVAYGILEERRGLNETGVFLATAHPAKFMDLLVHDMNLEVPMPESLQAVQDLPILSEDLEPDVEALRARLRA